MTTDYLIIGRGICGTFLSHELQKADCSFLVIDDPGPFSASKVASGIINPVTGRRIVKTWMIDELMPFAWDAYTRLEEELTIKCIRQTTTIDFFPTPQMRLSFLDRFAEDWQYLSLPTDASDWIKYFNYDFGYGSINPCYLVDLATLLDGHRRLLLQKGQLREEKFEPENLVIEIDSVRYQNITAGKIIFCEGIAGASNLWFKNLPFAPNKGEVLIAEMDSLPLDFLFKKGITIVPWKDGLYWIGSSHEWKFEDSLPTKSFREKTEAQLKAMVKAPFRIVDHLAAIRPATLERRPFIGFHPLYPSLGIFNGMGTKGCSLAPFFARNLAQHLTKKLPLMQEADVLRFKNVLSRK